MLKYRPFHSDRHYYIKTLFPDIWTGENVNFILFTTSVVVKKGGMLHWNQLTVYTLWSPVKRCKISFFKLVFQPFFILDQTASVSCGENKITVYLEKRRFYKFKANQLHLRYASCKGIENATHFLITTSLDSCGTLRNEAEDFLI